MAVTSSKWGTEHGVPWFPSWFLWPLFFLTSALRVYYVLQPKNWWIMHPDEVFQALEVAHAEMYGYGFRAYEYSPPPEMHSDTDIPHYRRLEVDHGMAALRSYLLPRAYVLVTWALELVGLHFNPFLTWKVAHTLAASTLPLAVYRYVRAVFRSHDTACLAAILCVASTQLHVLGTHTLVNSLLSAPVFWVLTHLYTLVNPPFTETHTARTEMASRNKMSMVYGFNHHGQNNASTKGHINTSNTRTVFSRRQARASGTKGKQKQHKTGAAHKQGSSPSGSVNCRSVNSSGSVTHDFSILNATTAKLTSSRDSSFEKGGKNDAIHKPSHPCLSQNGHTGAADDSITRNSPFTLKCNGFLRNLGYNFSVGFVLAVCVYIRIDIVALVIIVLLPHWSPFRTRYSDVIVCLCGSVFGLGVGVMDDFWCYGWGVLTPYNWFRFNVEKDYSSILFGRNAFYQYILEIFLDNVGITMLSVVCCLCGVLHVMYPREMAAASPEADRGAMDLHPSWPGSIVRSCVSWLLLLTLYSGKGHKEMRFVHNIIVLVLITWAVLFQSALLRLLSSSRTQKQILSVGVALFVFSQWQDVAHLTDNPARGGNKMGFKLAGDTQDINQCLYYISTCHDVTGVFLDRNLYATGGYPLLHKDVPIFTIFADAFREFRMEDRVVERAKNLIGPRKNVSVTDISKFSNYLTSQNSLYVFKFVLEDPRFNYFVAFFTGNFTIFGLGEPVFRSGTYKVYRRPVNPSPEQQQLMTEAISIAPSSNATVLLHEADMLSYHGAYLRAQGRFRLVLDTDPSMVGAYFPLAACHFKLGDTTGAIAVMKECYERFERTKCEKRRPPLIHI